MKTKPKELITPPNRPAGLSAESIALLDKVAAHWDKLLRMPKARRHAELIKRGILTPEGKLPVYPMDHVPLGPRE